MTINLNDQVTVRLTEFGKCILTQSWGISAADTCFPSWRTGTLRMSLWQMAETFGPFMRNGPGLPFETTMELDTQ